MSRSPATVSEVELRAAARAIAAEAALELVVLFGSAAVVDRDRPPEDLDIGVLARRGLADPLALTNRLIELLGVQAVDVVDLRRADALLMALVARDGVPLHESEPGAFSRFWSLAARRFADTRKFREAEHDEILEFVRRTSGDR